MGSFYIGCYMTGQERYCETFKIGETSHDTPAKRLRMIRVQHGPFACYHYLIMRNTTKPERLMVESYVRMKLDREFNQFTHEGNDHFTIKCKNPVQRQKAMTEFSVRALALAVECCELYGLDWEIGTRRYTTGF